MKLAYQSFAAVIQPLIQGITFKSGDGLLVTTQLKVAGAGIQRGEVAQPACQGLAFIGPVSQGGEQTIAAQIGKANDRVIALIAHTGLGDVRIHLFE